MMKIQVNQVGFLPGSTKTATIKIGDITASDFVDFTDSGKSENGGFRVRDVNSGETVFEGMLSDEVHSVSNGEINRVADFSEFNRPGRYVVECDLADEASYEFEIGENVYDELLKESIKFFYMQRCGCELPKAYAGDFAHGACHNTPARIYGTDKFIDVTGGWHDAGDYGRYIVPAAKAVVDLMMAYEFYPEVVGRAFIGGAGTSGNTELLDEIKYELDWMLKMQDPESGGLYHKVTCASFCGFIMPQEEREELIVSPMSDAATADFAAAMAYAYRTYKAAGEKLGGARADEYVKAAEGYLAAANRAMAFLENGGIGTFKNPEGVVTGEYGDETTSDEYFWAYAEMFKTTGDKKYEKLLKEMDIDKVPGGFSWLDIGDYGFYAYVSAAWDKDEELFSACMKRLEDEASDKYKNYRDDPYGASIHGEYIWGCTMDLIDHAKRGILLDKLTGRCEFKEMADAQINYLLGNNPNGKCFVTGFGTDTVKNPHHRPSGFKGMAMPGMVAGGPEPRLLDEVAVKLLKDVSPAKCYLDITESYSTNEVTIYWNSPLVFVLGYLMSR